MNSSATVNRGTGICTRSHRNFADGSSGEGETSRGSETTGPLRKMALMKIELNHYAFKVSEAEFDEILGRIKAESLPYGSEPHSRADMKINHRSGGRSVDFCDPNGHILELLTVG